MAAAKLAKDWRLINAALLPAHAPWREGAAASGNLLARARKAGPARAQFRAVREGGEQHDAVGVRWTCEEGRLFGQFDDFAGIDDRYARAEVRRDRDIAGDEQGRRALLRHQPLQQVAHEITTLGEQISAMAIATRCAMPPLSSCG